MVDVFRIILRRMDIFVESDYEPSKIVKKISKSMQDKASEANYHLTEY